MVRALSPETDGPYSSVLGDDAKILVDEFNRTHTTSPTTDSEILVIYCRAFTYAPGAITRGHDAAGFATYLDWCDGFYSNGNVTPALPWHGYRNKIFLSQDFWKPFTLAHEMVHLLSNAGHYGKNYGPPDPDKPPVNPDPKVRANINHNLMRYGSSTGNTQVTDSKRLYNIQEGAIDLAKQPQ